MKRGNVADTLDSKNKKKETVCVCVININLLHTLACSAPYFVPYFIYVKSHFSHKKNVKN